MKINKIKTLNFQGLKGKKEYDFNDKIVAICEENGSGKTSFLNAIRYGLTNVEPDGEIVFNGEDEAAVKLELNNGASITKVRSPYKGKATRYYFNDAKSTLKEINEYLESYTGVPVDNSKIITSSNLLNSLSNQEFAELLLTYLPEEMTIEKVIERYPEASNEEINIIKENLPSNNITTDDISSFYKLVYDRRKILKQEIKKLEAVIENYGPIKEKNITQENILNNINKLQSKRDEAVKYEQELKSYQNYINSLKKQEENINNLKKNIESIKAKAHSDDEIKSYNENIRSLRKSLEISFSSGQSLANSLKLLKDSLENINKPICPLSDKVVCTTDKSAAKSDLENGIKEVESSIEKERENYKKLKNEINSLENSLSKIIEENNNYNRVEDLRKQLKSLEDNKLEEIKEPKPLEKSKNDIEKEINDLRRVETELKNDEVIKNKKKLLVEYRGKLVDYENLVSAFSPKGKVKEAITSYYLEAFSEPCNKKAVKLFDNMNLKFVSNNGAEVLVDKNGNGKYIDFNSLSNGEKAVVTFLILSMLNELSGLKILILDELSVLDDKVFNKFIDLILENPDEYDMCVIACVNHSDTVDSLNKKGIKILNKDNLLE